MDSYVIRFCLFVYVTRHDSLLFLDLLHIFCVSHLWRTSRDLIKHKLIWNRVPSLLTRIPSVTHKCHAAAIRPDWEGGR